MTTQIVTAGRKDMDEFFKLSDVFTAERLNHTPLLVFIATEDAIQVRLLDHARNLLAFPDDTPVMRQWRGATHSDFSVHRRAVPRLRGGGTCAAEKCHSGGQSRWTAGRNQAGQLRVRR